MRDDNAVHSLDQAGQPLVHVKPTAPVGVQGGEKLPHLLISQRHPPLFRKSTQLARSDDAVPVQVKSRERGQR